jgi:hypothetical protein
VRRRHGEPGHFYLFATERVSEHHELLVDHSC